MVEGYSVVVITSFGRLKNFFFTKGVTLWGGVHVLGEIFEKWRKLILG